MSERRPQLSTRPVKARKPLLGNPTTNTSQKTGSMAALTSLLAFDIKGEDLVTSLEELMLPLAAGFQYREEGIFDHLTRISRFVLLLCNALELKGSDARRFRLASLFHDIGMVHVPYHILSKRGKLAKDEITVVQQHTLVGYELLSQSSHPLIQEAANIAWSHHEHFNGNGYPRKLKGDNIPLGGRLMALADVFDALTTRRPHKEPYPAEVAKDIISGLAGQHFDPLVVEAFLASFDDFVAVTEGRHIIQEAASPQSSDFELSDRDRCEGEVLAQSGYFSCPYCKNLHPMAADFCNMVGAPLREIHKLSGRVLNEKYLLQRAAGAGGMGAVYESVHLRTERRLAIKLLDPLLARNKTDLTRFFEEARIFATVNHPNLVEVLDIDQTGDGIPYMVMEYLDGQDLAHLMHEQQGMSEVASATLVLEILRTLQHVHSKGIVHRDLKPENVYLIDSGTRLKVLDFGISLQRSTDPNRARLTEEGTFMGTPEYMSPEQALGRSNLDHRSDLFTVGELLYELLTGVQVFDGPSTLAIMMAVTNAPIRPIQELMPNISSEMRQVVERALQRPLERRFQSAMEFRDALRPIAARDPRFHESILLIND